MLRLNDFLNPQQIIKGIAQKRSLKNSIKRNTILPSIQPIQLHLHSQYQSKLTGHNFKQKDLLLLFEHIYQKQTMSISDRNFIKRILLTIFPQGLIFSGGKKLIQFTKFICIKKGHHHFGNGMLNLIMKGTVKITSQFYQKIASQGQYFGHLELLTNMDNNSYQFIAETDTYIISINEEGFLAGIQDYFLKLYMYKTRVIPKIIADKLQPIEGFLLCEEMKRKSYGIGQKISKKGQKITEIMFLQQGKLSQNVDLESSHLKAKIQQTVGLSQLVNNIPYHTSNNFTLQQTKGYIITLQQFENIINRQMLNLIKQQLTIISIEQSCLPSQFPRSKTQVTQNSIERFKNLQMESDNLKNFIRVRKVNLPYCKPKLSLSNKESPKISRISNYETSFVFIKNASGFQKNKQARQDRANKIMSVQISPFKPYLQNIEVPSLSMYKEYEII